jgi:hypothetical protein
MGTKFVWFNGDWVDVAEFGPRPASVFPMIVRDTPAYVSPVTKRVIDGRAARREDLKRSGCREVDPSEFKPVYRNPEFAKKHGLQLGGDPLKAPERITTIDK